MYIPFVVAKNELSLLLRERTLYLLIGIFLIMATLSTGIGFATEHTIQSVYQAAVNELAVNGQSAPAFPVNTTPLGIITNMIIYNALIGSLLAIALGYFIGVHDRVSGVLKVLVSRPVKMSQVFFGKILTLTGVTAGMLGVAFLVSVLTLSLFGVFSYGAMFQVALFYLVSFLYISGFAFLALLFAFSARSASSALLYALFVWMAITFALPELSSALYPTSSLNPVLPPSTVLDSPLLSVTHTVVYPFSVSEHYKSLSATVLGVDTPVADASSISSLVHIAIVFLWFLFTFLTSFRFFSIVDPTLETRYA